MPETVGLNGDPREETPRAFALNRTATTPDAAITLLGFTVAGGFVRVSGLVCFRRPDLRLARMPALGVAALHRPSLIPIGAHLLPQGDLAWVAWIFERPEEVLGTYDARIAQLDLAHRMAGPAEVMSPGPWVFRFQLRRPPAGSPRRVRDGARLAPADA